MAKGPGFLNNEANTKPECSQKCQAAKSQGRPVVAWSLPQLVAQLCFFRKYFFPPHLEIPEHSMNSEYSILLTQDQLCSTCALWPRDMQHLNFFAL